MSEDASNARRDVNNAISSAGSAAVGQIVDTANSSKRKREENRKKKEEEARGREGTEQSKVLCPFAWSFDLLSPRFLTRIIQ